MIERANAPGLSQPPGYSHVVVASGRRLVTTAGAVPLDAEGNLVGPSDRRAQARQTLENLALEAVGATACHVIKTTVYVVADDRADLVEVWDAVQESGMAQAASTLVGVAMLGYEGQLVEIEAIAVLEWCRPIRTARYLNPSVLRKAGICNQESAPSGSP